MRVALYFALLEKAGEQQGWPPYLFTTRREAQAKSRDHHAPGTGVASIAGGHHALRVTVPTPQKACATSEEFDR